MLKSLVTVFLVATGIQYATAIMCYECNSVNNSMCLDPTIYDKETVQKFLSLSDCGSQAQGNQDYFCRKIVQTILHKGHDSEVRVHRGCGWVRSRKDCYKADNEDHLETVCQCFADGCNTATNVEAKWTGLVASVVIILNKWC